MTINAHYVLVEKIEEPKSDGFTTVQVQDKFLYQGKIIALPDCPVFIDNRRLALKDVVIFVKYSPDTHEYEGNKFVKAEDILAVL